MDNDSYWLTLYVFTQEVRMLCYRVTLELNDQSLLHEVQFYIVKI